MIGYHVEVFNRQGELRLELRQETKILSNIDKD
jgi:hypothetical protein